MTEIVSFLEGKTPDYRGRTFAMLLQQSDHQAETNHDYIQWMFPLDEPSRSVNGVPVLTELEIDEIRQSSHAQANLAKSARWFLGFLERNDHWITNYNHNHLRITRVIRSLRLLASDKAADEFRDKVLALAGDNLNLVDQKARAFWNSN
ncbi:opioid growth factor receptor-related protein [Alphaproteobacteria bacterium]|nr:opioid growth factor receptor-related protein [Alphaproteobacteria bacterium]